MKKAFLVLLLTSTILSRAQDVVVIKHINYTTHYSKSLHYPVLVEWWETKAKSQCATPLKRKYNFRPDPQLVNDTNLKNDYIHSNTDRGHMCPTRQNLCQGAQVQNECFYFSNISAQYHSLNAGDWKSLENFTYNTSIEKDSIHVWAGNIGSLIKIGTTTIPRKCWKVVYIVKTKEISSFLFNNDRSKPTGYLDNKVPLKVIEKLTGFKFKIK